MRRIGLLSLLLGLLLAGTLVSPAVAHQPYFEEEDIEAGSPWEIEDPSISTALYATLDSPGDVDYFSFSKGKEEEQCIVFVGNYLHYPNVDAVLYFHQDIWPLIKSRLPELKFYVVGQGPPLAIQNLSQEKNIIVTGKVDDVRPFLKKARVFICPVRLGGGFRGKILEAMAIGRPIVSTSLGAEGIPASHEENIILADNPEEFAKGTLDLMNDDKLFEKIRVQGRKLVEEKYGWEKGVEVMEGILEKMLINPSSKN